MTSYDQLKFKILWKLYHHHYWGKRHTPIENVPKGLPPQERAACFGVISDLIKEGWLVKKKTKHGEDVYLNPRKNKEIRRFLEEVEKRFTG